MEARSFLTGALLAASGLMLLAGDLAAQPRRVLYITHSAGFRHSSIPESVAALHRVAASSGRLEVTASEDVSQLNSATLATYDAVLFFTSGELPISSAQKEELLAWVRSGKGFGGVHSATDTLYGWAEYEELIGARFNGHPWVHEVRMDVEDPDHPAVAHLTPPFSMVEEIYQFRGFSRARSRVLVALDTASVDLRAEGVNPDTEDFPLAWCHPFGEGRVFYTALGHFEETWQDARFERLLEGALEWLTGLVPADARPRQPGPPEVFEEGIANAASYEPRMTISANSYLSIFGRNLTPGSAMAADARSAPYRLGGAAVKLNGRAIPLVYASPGQINALAPRELQSGTCETGALVPCEPGFRLEVTSGDESLAAPVALRAAGATPGIFTVTVHEGHLTLWGTGFGPVEMRDGFEMTVTTPTVRIQGTPARVLYSGLAPGWPGLYQINVELATGPPSPALIEVELGEYRTSFEFEP